MSGLATTLRIARRDAWRHRGRSALIVAMIALPVTAGVAIDVIVRSGEMTPAQQAESVLAGADAYLVAPEGVDNVQQSWWFGGPSSIDVNAPVGTGADTQWVNVDERPARPAAEILPLLPPGSRVTAWRHAEQVPVKAGGGQYVSASADILDMTSPAAGGRYSLVTGTAPAADDQIAVTTHLAQRLGVKVGDIVHASAPAKNYVISALVAAHATAGRNIPATQYDALVALPGALGTVTSPFDTDAGQRYLVTSPQPITLPAIDRLNSAGIGVLSKAVVADPAARATVSPTGTSPLLIVGAVIGIVMAIMQVVFLAGPAFAIGARRMRRQLGQLTATGARPRQLGLVVLGTGLVLGVAGSLTGLAAGIGVGALLRPALREWAGYKSLAFRFVPAEVLGVAALGVVTAVLAALMPALATARTSPLALLGRQPATNRGVRWWSLAGGVIAAAGVVITLWMAVRTLPDGAPGPVVQNRALGLAVGVVLVEVGLLLAVPLIVQRFARLGALLPLAGRLALRDADRHRGRTAPAIAAVTVCATAAVMLAVLITSAGKNAESRYQAGIPVGDVQVRFGISGFPLPSGIGTHTVADAEAAIRAQWPGATTLAYATVPDSAPAAPAGAGAHFPTYRALAVPLENLCPYGETTDLVTADQVPDGAFVPIEYAPTVPTAADEAKAATDWRCTGRSYSMLTSRQAHVYRGDGGGIIYNTHLPTVTVGGPDLLRALTGIDDPAAAAALAAGGAVVMDRTLLAADGTIRSVVLGGEPAQSTTTVTADGTSVGTAAPGGGTDTRAVPAVLGAYAPTPLGVVLSPQAAERLGWSPQPAGLIVDPGRPVTQEQTDDLALAIAAGGVWAQATAETGHLVGAGESVRQPLTAVLVVIVLLAAGCVMVITALGLADARPDYATLAGIGAPPRIRRLTTGWTAATVTFLGCLVGGVIGLVPAWGILRLMQTIQRTFADPIDVPWLPLAAVLIAAPLAAFTLGSLLPRSRLPMVARTD